MSDTLPPCDHDECSLIACSKDEIEKLVATLQNNSFGWISKEDLRSIIRLVRKELHTEVDRLRATLRVIADYDERPIWMDSRDDAADNILDLAREALKEQPKK